MEHRYSERKHTEMLVVISCPRVGLFRGTMRNLSLGGMYVESDCVSMPINAPVTVSIQTYAEDSGQSLEASGMVVHQRGRAFGVMFDEHDELLNRDLRDLLHSLVPQAVANF